MDKDEIRKKFKEIRKNLKGGISEAFFETDIYKKALSVFTFVSFRDEINTYPLIKRALEDKKIVAVPYMTGSPHEMVFIKINSTDELKPNKIGIPEAQYNEYNVVKADENTIIIVPGLAFDNDFFRIGYGGGYYDKYIDENKCLACVGVCFEEQLTETVPRNKYDKNVDIIVTDKNIRRKQK